MAIINGSTGDDSLRGTSEDDTINALEGNDIIFGSPGNDQIYGNSGDDQVYFFQFQNSITQIDSGEGNDKVSLGLAGRLVPLQRGVLEFDFNGVGNGNPNEVVGAIGFDGGLAVRLQIDNGQGVFGAPLGRFDDEGVTFFSSMRDFFISFNISVRDSNTGFYSNNIFQNIIFGTELDDIINPLNTFNAYVNGGVGNDQISGTSGQDLLVGATGNDILSGGDGNDEFIGGTGEDLLAGGAGTDTAIFNVSTDGADSVDLGAGNDIVQVSAATAGQVRLSFTSAQVGNGSVNDTGNMANQDGCLAVRLQAENGTDGLTGAVSRFDDEGITFVAAAGTTFDVRDLVAGTQRGDLFEVVTLGTGGNDVLTAVQAARPYYFNAGAGNDVVTGGTANDFLVGGAGNDVLSGAAGNDAFIGGAGNDAFDGGAGTDRAIFTFALSAATVGVSANGTTTITSPDGTDTFRGIEQFVFSDRTIDNADGSPLVDDVFYLSRNPDVAAAGVDADTHYFQFGAAEGRNPNAFFSTTGYLAANPDVRAAGVNPLTHYDTTGFREGRDPGANFDNELYLARNPDVRAAGVDPLRHYLEFGQAEGRTADPAIGRGSDIGNARGFDAEFYLLSNPDVARAAITAGGDSYAFARRHYDTFGVGEARDPNAIFDTDGYLAAYPDVARAGVNPLNHYDQSGFREGRDPSVGFDSSAYLAANADVRAAGIDPMVHYLQFGIYEGRSSFGDGTFGGGNVG